MNLDKNKKLIAKGDVVLVPKPNENDCYSHEFIGIVVSIDKDYVIIVDNLGDNFSVEGNRLEVL